MNEEVKGPWSRVIREPAYGSRLQQACDANPHCPPLHKGRLAWIADQLKTRFDMKVSNESVSKWCLGETKPRPAKNEKLAEMLGVDPVWLYLGIAPDMAPRERRLRNAEADGAINLVAGFIQMDGGHPAFPAEDDTRAKLGHIDLYAVIRGANYPIHVSRGLREGTTAWKFPVPVLTGDQPPIILGVAREGFNVRIIEITSELFDKHSDGGSPVAMVVLGDKLIDEHQLEGFTNRL